MNRSDFIQWYRKKPKPLTNQISKPLLKIKDNYTILVLFAFVICENNLFYGDYFYRQYTGYEAIVEWRFLL